MGLASSRFSRRVDPLAFQRQGRAAGLALMRIRPKGGRLGSHRSQDSGRVLQTRPKSAVGGRSPAHGVAVGDGSIPSTRSQRFAREARTLPLASLRQTYRWLNFTSWIMSSGE